MSTETVFRYKIRDPSTAQMVLSRRMATRKFIETVGGVIKEDSAVVIDATLVDSNGQTSIDFVP